jgi:predicted DNA-binding protein
MKNISLQISRTLDEQIKRLANKRGQKKEDLIKKALEMYSREKVNHPSCLDLAIDLSGCVEASPDMSSNKNYMNGYGE